MENLSTNCFQINLEKIRVEDSSDPCNLSVSFDNPIKLINFLLRIFWLNFRFLMWGMYGVMCIEIGCLGSVRSNCNSKKWIIWFIMISHAKFQPPNSSITASNCIPRFWSFGRFVWKSKKLPNFFIIEKLFTFLFWISWFGYLRVHHVGFSSNLFLVWK